MIAINLQTPRYWRSPAFQGFTNITTPRFTRDVDELRTWNMDIRRVLADNAIRDMNAEIDAAIIADIGNNLPQAVPVPIGDGVTGSHLLGGWGF